MSWIAQDVLFGHCFVLKSAVFTPNIRWASTQRGLNMTGDTVYENNFVFVSVL